MSALDLIAEAEQRGARFSVIGDSLEATPAHVFDPSLTAAIGEHKLEIIEQLRRREETAKGAIAAAERLLRECRFAPEPAPCRFHCGRPSERCKRCGASVAEHYGVHS